VCAVVPTSNSQLLAYALQILAKRKGFVRIALQTGAKLVRAICCSAAVNSMLLLQHAVDLHMALIQ
jgi:DNA-binding phage protein